MRHKWHATWKCDELLHGGLRMLLSAKNDVQQTRPSRPVPAIMHMDYRLGGSLKSDDSSE